MVSSTAPYGSWPSPLSAAAVSAASPRFDGARFVGDEVWWSETVADEGGRSAIRRRTPGGDVHDVLAAPWNARSRVHEYGGGGWTASDDGTLFFVEKSDQRVWMLPPGAEPTALTPEAGDVRHGGLVLSGTTLLAIRESHAAGAAPRRHIVRIPLDGSGGADPAAVVSVVGGSDFVAQPALSPDGSRLAWIAWNHPDMPWDRTELRVGRLQDGVVAAWATVAGGTTAPLQPVWTGPDSLLFCDDPSGRWNLWRLRLGEPADGQGPAEPVAEADADTGGALWVLGSRWFAPLSGGRIVAVRTQGSDELVVIAPDGSERRVAATVTTDAVVEDSRGSRVLVSGAGPYSPGGLWLLDVDALADADTGADAGAVADGLATETAQAAAVRGGRSPGGPEWTPRARAFTVQGPTGPVHAFDYPPTSPDVRGPAGELPPYVVLVHGGPTAHVGDAASGRISYLTSRGIGVLNVNYGGSTGYGRAYRERLRGQWGIVDVADVAAAAQGLAAAGRADPARIAIAGGSAGGWTVLAALVGTDVFAAGLSRYGVGDARALAADTHDFEARYLDGLIGPLPEAEDLYLERSPLSRPERFRVPLLLLQGSEDTVVPPSQAEAIRDALVERGVPHAYVLYEGEAHGFRGARTVVNALETELAFLGAVFGFVPPGVKPIELQ